MSGSRWGKRGAWGYAGYELRPNRLDLDPNLPERIICSQCEYELPQRLFSATQLAHLNDALDTQGIKALDSKGDFSVKCIKCVEAGKKVEFKCRFCNEWLPGWHFARSQHTHAFQQSHSLPVCMACQDRNFGNVNPSRAVMLSLPAPPEELEEVPGMGLSSRTILPKSPNLILDWDENEGLASGRESPPNLILDWDENEGRLSIKSPNLLLDLDESEGGSVGEEGLILKEKPLSREEVEIALRLSRETEQWL
ncbi:uncharacterized protein N7503_008489 [Penicillium pulvis]|uniref:uncharacterized protein n=1 Tax=Penicillium pulvis TaxID=1562058 RepID=UPI002549677D|nr:uncharacterized protein N7503_008489 [Penicillium pulvis]KAJ5792511.1 hypothetical protein N7503_008489 [Penicillium pulvis]